MTTEMLTSDKVRDALNAANAKAAQAWATADKLRADMIAAGADPSEGENFEKVTAAFREYDGAKEEAALLETKLAELSRIDAMYRGGGRLPSGDGRALNERRSQRFGERFTMSDQYQRLHRDGVFSQGDALAAQIIGRGFDRPIELLSRDELEAVLATGRIQATTITGGGATSAGPFIQNDLQPGYFGYARKTPRISAIVGQGVTDSDVVEYVTQSAPTSAAAETAEDTAASESTYAYATNTTNVREITHFVPITLRAMADAGQMRSIIEGDLATDALDRLDTELYSGGGTGVDLTGITVTSGIGTFALGGYTRLDAVHRALTTVRTAAGVLMETDYIAMHPNDWQKVRLDKDGNGGYLLGPANFDGAQQIWGVPVVVSTVATEGTILAGNFGRGAKMWLREGLSVTSGLDGNDFTKRRISLLAAIRVAFAVPYAGAFCTVTSF